MLARKKCKNCIKSLTLKTLELSTAGKNRKNNKSLAEELIKNFRLGCVPAKIFTGINRRIKQITGNPDAFYCFKEREMQYARQIAARTRPPRNAGLETLLLFSAKGNTLDFFKDIENSAAQMQKKTSFSRNAISSFRSKLKRGRRLLFFADNAGEIFFDLPLVLRLAGYLDVTYVVKASAVQNDMTLREAKKSGLAKKFPRIVTSGNDAVGIELESISKTLARELARCDIILAKGMGYYETFSELPRFRGRIFHLLMAKCLPVARSLGTEKESYVFIQG